MRKKVKKRSAVLLMALAVGLCIGSACKKESGEEMPGTVTPVPGVNDDSGSQSGTEQTPGTSVIYKEAPSLQGLVEARKLPEVGKRMPVRTDVYTISGKEIGTYGEEVQFAAETAEEMTGQLVSEGLFCYATDGTIAPNIAKSYTVNSDFTKYTIYLREGMRWSDGVLFTADDCIFFYEEMCIPETFGEPLWPCFTVKNASGKQECAVFRKLDDYSFEIVFSNSKPEFLSELLAQGGICFAPEHYHVNLMPEYMGSDAAKAKATDMGYGSTAEMLRAAVRNAWNTPGVPTLNPYCLSAEEGANDVKGNYYEFVRNPYYWKVDAEGKQLPYLERLGFTRISGESQKMLLTTEGFLSVSPLSGEQVAEAQESAERGSYHIVTWTEERSYAVKDSVKNFPTECPYEEKVRGLGAAHAECWFVE